MGGGGLDGQFYERMVSFTKNLWCCIREKVKHEYLILTSDNQRLEKCIWWDLLPCSWDMRVFFG